jgi:hypothetical protein
MDLHCVTSAWEKGTSPVSGQLGNLAGGEPAKIDSETTQTTPAQRQPPCRIGFRCGEWPLIVELDGNALAHAPPGSVYILVVHYREEPSVEIAIVLLTMLLRYCADEGFLDDIIGPEHIVGHRAGIASQARDAFSRSQLKSFILTAHFSGKASAGCGA